LGCVLYEMVTGRRPFARETSADTMAAILNDPPPPLTEVGSKRPAALDLVLRRCLEKAAEKRFPSGREVASALRAIGRDAPAADTDRPRNVETCVSQRDSGGRPKPSPGASVAVLPFVNMSSDKENEYFSDGLAEELINALNHVKGLHVASRT